MFLLKVKSYRFEGVTILLDRYYMQLGSVRQRVDIFWEFSKEGQSILDIF